MDPEKIVPVIICVLLAVIYHAAAMVTIKEMFIRMQKNILNSNQHDQDPVPIWSNADVAISGANLAIFIFNIFAIIL